MTANEMVQVLSARSHALRTATSGGAFDLAKRNLLAALRQVGTSFAGAVSTGNMSSGDANRVNAAIRAATNTYNRQPRPGATAAPAAAAAGGGGKAAPAAGYTAPTTAAGGGKARAGARAGAAIGTSRTRTAAAASASRAPSTSELNLPDLPGGIGFDTGGVGLFTAIGRTLSGSVPIADLIPLWNPAGPLLSRPATKLFLLASGLAITAAVGFWALEESKKPAPPARAAA